MIKSIELNETPVRTSKNFNANNIKINDIEIPDNISSFYNIDITGECSNIQVEQENNDYSLVYGLGNFLNEYSKAKSNKELNIIVNSKTPKEFILSFNFDENNLNLIENIKITANENCKATIIIKYKSDHNVNAFHNGIIKTIAKNMADINIIIVNLMNDSSNNFLSIENTLEDSSKVKYTIVDFGGKHSITNFFSNLIGNFSNNIINTIYLGKNNQLFDLNYIAELRGVKSNVDIEVQGALKDTAHKHFKGTIDFKKGCKKATGNENEFCMLLSDKAKSLALPMLLCSEEDVEGNHSSATGKIGEKELFYIMSRGFELKEAMKLMVRAKFNRIIENIKNEELKEEILNEIDNRLD